jgi:FKBP-type peptidyl-prolyl cis-trans isomerase
LRLLVIVMLLAAPVPAQPPSPPPAPAAEKPRDPLSYALGVDVARKLQAQGVEVDIDEVRRGMGDVVGRRKLAMTEEELTEAMQGQLEALRRRSKFGRAAAERNRVQGRAFLAENAKAPGVVVLPSGVQYEVLAQGRGEPAGAVEAVRARYRGTLADGTEFDRSPPGEPVTLKLADVVPGLAEALRLMSPGARWRVVVPPERGFGRRWHGDRVAPNAVLVYEVEREGAR